MNAKEEILEELGDMQLSLEDDRVIGYDHVFNRIREILSTHELVPIDNTPSFDPERCGFHCSAMIPGTWFNELARIDHVENQILIEASRVRCNAPWPATHSAGVALLKAHELYMPDTKE